MNFPLLLGERKKVKNLFNESALIKRKTVARNEVGGFDTDGFETLYESVKVRIAPDTDKEEFKMRGQVNYSTHKMAMFREDYETELVPEDIIVVGDGEYRLLSVIEPSQKRFQIQFKLEINDKGSTV